MILLVPLLPLGVRWDSPFVLATAGTLALHLIIAVGGDALVVLYPPLPDPPAIPIIRGFDTSKIAR